MLTSDDVQRVSSRDIEAFRFENVEGRYKDVIYNARVPYPKQCLDSIDAAFHLYDRKGRAELDAIYLISHGYTWR